MPPRKRRAPLYMPALTAGDDATDVAVFGRTVEYVPAPKHIEFWKQIDRRWERGKLVVGLFTGGNGTGKTAMVANAIINFMASTGMDDNGDPMGPPNPFFQTLRIFHEFHRTASPRRARIVSTATNLGGKTEADLGIEFGSGGDGNTGGALINELQKWGGPDMRLERGDKAWYSQILFGAGTGFVDCLTFNQARMDHESATLPIILFDEPPPEQLFDSALSRMRSPWGGLILLPCTPVNFAPWLETRIGELAKKGVARVVHVQCAMDDALEENGGHLKRSQMDSMLDMMSPEEREARRTGQSVQSVNRVWRFDERVHVIACPDYGADPGSELGMKRMWTRVMVLDPHPKRPWAMQWWALDGNGNEFLFDEWPNKYSGEYVGIDYHNIKRDVRSIDEMCELIKDIEKRHPFLPTVRIIDPNSGRTQIRSANGCRTLIQELSARGLMFREGRDNTDENTRIVQGLMEITYGEDGQPRSRLKVSSRCANSIFQMQHVSWVTGFSAALLRAQADKIDKKFKDFGFDCVAYYASCHKPAAEDLDAPRKLTEREEWLAGQPLEPLLGGVSIDDDDVPGGFASQLSL